MPEHPSLLDWKLLQDIVGIESVKKDIGHSLNPPCWVDEFFLTVESS
jgi:hypothetical protein